MSYDVALFRAPEGVELHTAYAELVENEEKRAADLDSWLKQPVPESFRAEMRRVADEIKRWRPGLSEFEPQTPLPWIELDDEELQVQWNIYADQVAVTMPYFRDKAEDMFGCVVESIEIIREAIGYSAFDPQLDRAVGASDVREMVERYRAMDAKLPEILASAQLQKHVSKKPWWRFW